MQTKGIRLFDERHLQRARAMKETAMFSYALRDFVLPPIRNTKSFNVVRDDKMMERAGVGPHSARTLPWFENERETYQHHAEYLQRLSKLREELIREEQTNLANALERLRMRSYGKEFVYSKPKERTSGKRYPAKHENAQRKTLITTLEKFQKMRPKKLPPTILPLEGKSVFEISAAPATERIERQHGQSKSTTERSVDESVRLNLQRLNGHTVASIPRGRRNTHRDMFVESSTMRKHVKSSDANNSSAQDEKIVQLQKQRQKALRMKQEAQKAEQMRLAPQSFKIDGTNDEDKMNMDSLKDYYCVYYVPAPSPEHIIDRPDMLPSIPSAQSCTQVISDLNMNNGRNGVPFDVKYAHGCVNGRIGVDYPISPCPCNCTCRMFISGSKVEAPFGHVDPFTHSSGFYSRHDTGTGSSKSGNGSVRNTSREIEINEWSEHKHYEPVKRHTANSMNGDKRQIVVDMPTIVFNPPKTPEPSNMSASGGGLVKAFKQKELRQKELSNLMEDVKELNKMTETLVNTS